MTSNKNRFCVLCFTWRWQLL